MEDTYKYKVLSNGVVISRGTTKDFKRRASDIKSMIPNAIIRQVGGKVTFQEAERWLGSC